MHPRAFAASRCATFGRHVPHPTSLVHLVSLASLIAFVMLVMAGCAVSPAYQPPVSTLPAAWQAALPERDGDRPTPADWWASFDDPALATLVGWADRDNPTLDKALAQIAIARATLATSDAALQPTLSGSASAARGRSATGLGGTAGTSTRSASLDASWEIDLFGRLRSARSAAQARVQARVDDWAASRVSLAAEVADDYVQYRGCRLLAASYAEQAASLAETARITAASVQAGFTAPTDDDLAQASLASGRNTVVDQQTSCELLVKALVALTGVPEPTLRQTLDARSDGLPMPAVIAVTRVPADLLRQRADIASAERTLAAANADVGQAEARRYPSLSLSGLISIAATGGGSALTTSAFGPALSLPLFDGGSNRAAVASARASVDAAFADYQSTLRTAVQEVEQALVQLYGASRRSEDAALAATRYERYFEAAELNWRSGGTDLLTLELARRNASTARASYIGVRRDQLRQYIALYKALGGGFQADPPAVTPIGSAS